MVLQFFILALKRSLLVVALIGFVMFYHSGCVTINKVSYKQPLFDSTVVFEPQEGVYASIRIPALIITTKGTLLAFAEGRVGTASDWSEMDLLLRRSTDDGKTWEPNKIIAPRSGKSPTSNATPILSKDGTIHLLYQRDYARAYYTQSTDDGVTWSAPVDITATFEAFRPEYNWNVLAPGPGHAIQLKNGRLIVPVWLAASEKLTPKRNHYPSCVATIYSDDLGKTWKRGAIVANNSLTIKDPNESMVVALEDGRVMLSIRSPSEIRRKAVAYSPDGISNWSEITFDDELYEPICMSSIINVSTKSNSDKSRLLFINPDTRDNPKPPRMNLTAKLSYDEGQRWTVQKVINPGASGYSDVAIGADGTIYCLYETNTVGTGFNYSLVLKRFNLTWLTNGSDHWKPKRK